MRKTYLSWQYQPDGKRDLRLDWLRGYAVFAMSVVHLGINSHFDFLTGAGVFLIGAAEAFFFISGYTLGYISKGREFKPAISRLLKRTLVVYLVSIAIAFGFAAVYLLTKIPILSYLPLENIQDAAVWALGILTMRVSYNFSDILIAYVIYLGMAPFALWGLLKGRVVQVAGAIVVIYVFSQFNLELTHLPFASFRHLAASTPIFYGGLVIGFYSTEIAVFWKSWKLSRGVDILIGLICIVLIAGFVTDYAWLPVGRTLAEMNSRSIRNLIMPIHSMVFVFLFIRFFFLLITALWKPLNRVFGWLMLPLGRSALLAFSVHLIVIPLVWMTPGVSASLATWQATLWTFYFLGLLYSLVWFITWLRAKYLSTSSLGRTILDRFPTAAALISLMVFAVVAVLTLFPLQAWIDYHFP